ncbi:MAG TPA: phenylalanine--tRNA ligase subunit beta [Lachnospiraceae bacterium]|nr:phenylalanine--tRNA ligase subunit beta [Lachnospiraceae bacterium]
MNTPLSWIRAYVPELDCTEREYMDAMTMSGTKVEGYEKFDADLDKIIVGRIAKIEKHPDADKLVVCQVEINENGETIQIVTGAPNVEEGQKIPVVLDGGRVAGGHDGSKTPGGIKIKKGKLRGVESFGMMCSIEELGSSKEFYPDAPDNGIYILSDNPTYKDAPVGSDAIEVLGLHDANFEYEITSNRVDCFGVIGIAREAAATFDKEFIPPKVVSSDEGSVSGEVAADLIDVDIQAPELCSRYIARVVKNIRLAPSPEWMQRRLAASGIRPINNIVDITNYVMEEFGQPMHAFDYDTLEGHKIIVRRAEDGEKFVTLDGQERELDHDMLMICDANKSVAIGGIMGGENSMITDDVKTMLFEAACFNGTNIRKSGKKLGMRTDAQAKFEKGLDPNTAYEAINRACALIEELDAGDVVPGVVDKYPVKREPTEVAYDVDKINAFIGFELSEDQMCAYWDKVDLKPDRDKKVVHVPTWRQDIACLADLAEEVARFYGYDKIPTTLPKGETTMGGISPIRLIIKELRRTIEKYGFSEAMTFSFESPKVFDMLLIPEDDVRRKAIEIANPLGVDYSVMRTTPLNGILTSLATNYNNRNKDVRLYEMAKVYIAKSLPLSELPDEREMLTLGMYGAGDFYDLKGCIEELYTFGIKDIVKYVPNEKAHPYLHPGRHAEIVIDDDVIGYLGQVHPEVCDNYGIKTEAYVAVIDLKMMGERIKDEVKYQGIARFPAVNRDISLVMKKTVLAGQIEEIIRGAGGKLLEELKLFDVYEGENVGDDEKSLAYSIRFRAADRTLDDKDITAVMDKILKKLKEAGVVLRS